MILALVALIFSFCPVAAFADDLVHVDVAVSGYSAGNPPCSYYLQKHGPKDLGLLDEILLKKLRGWKTQDDKLIVRMILIPAKCVELVQPEPQDGFKKGFVLDTKGVTPDPADFVTALAGTYGSIAWDPKTHQLYGQYSVGNYQYDSVSDEYFVEVEWKIKDLMGFFEYRRYKKGEEIEINIPVAFCTRNLGDSQVRPRMDRTLFNNPEDPYSGQWTRLFDSTGKHLEPAYCLKLQNNLKVFLNQDEFMTDANLLPEPEGRFLTLLNSYETGAEAKPEDLQGWRSGRCFFRQDGDKEVAALLAGRLSQREDGATKVQLQRWAYATQKPDYFDALSTKDFGKLKKASDEYFDAGKGEGYLSGSDFLLYEGDLRKLNVRKVNEGILVKVIDSFFLPGGKVQNEPTRMCLFNRKISEN